MKPGQPGTACEGKYEMPPRRHTKPCSHGPDAAPPGVDARDPSPAAATAGSPSTAQAGAAVPCYGDGQSGDRIEAIYAHAAGTADRYTSLLAQMQSWAVAADDVFSQSAA